LIAICFRIRRYHQWNLLMGLPSKYYHQGKGRTQSRSEMSAGATTDERSNSEVSPFDPWAFAAFHSLALGHFCRGRYEEAANAARKAIQSNPAHSISYMLLAAPLAKLDRIEEAKAAAAEVLKLQPAFRYSRQFAGVDCAPSLAASLSEALRAIGLPE
jgi:tetratricopeptide (TPR) repeat protein